MKMLLATVALIICNLCTDNSTIVAVQPHVNNYNSLKEIPLSIYETRSYLGIKTPINKKQEETLKLPKLYPNPATNQLHIEFMLKLPARVQFNLLSSSGKVVRILSDEVFTVGKHYLETSLQNIPSGFYFVQYVQKGKTISTQRVQIF